MSNLPPFPITPRQFQAQKILRGAARGFIPSVMSSPLTPVVGANYGSSTLTSPISFLPNDSRLTQICGNMLLNGSLFQGAFVDAGGSFRQGANGQGQRFCTDSANLEFQMSDGGGAAVCQVRVGSVGGPLQKVTASDISTGASNYGLYYIKLAFGSRAPRLIEIYWDVNGQSQGFNIDGNAGQRIWAAPVIDEPKIMFFGDSYIAGAGATSSKSSLTNVAGDMLGAHVVSSGSGGTGYTNSGGSKKTYIQRIADASLFGPQDLIVVAGGANDGGASSAALTAATSAFLAALMAAQPSALIMVLGPWQFPTLATASTVDAAVTAGFNAVADLTRMKKIDSYGWQDQSGGNSATTIYQSSAVPGHPSDLGHSYMGMRLAEEITLFAKTLAGY